MHVRRYSTPTRADDVPHPAFHLPARRTPLRKSAVEFIFEKIPRSPRASAGFRLGGSMPPCRLRRRKFDYEMVHSEVYLNKYVVSIAPFSHPHLESCSLFCMFSLFNFSSIFPGVSADPICPYMRTPMTESPWRFSYVFSHVELRGFGTVNIPRNFQGTEPR